MGDFNARIGSLSDIISDIDSAPERQIIDQTTNQHGRDLIEFKFIDFMEAKYCVLNCRFGISNNNFTSVSRKGRSVVDFICVSLMIVYAHERVVQS